VDFAPQHRRRRSAGTDRPARGEPAYCSQKTAHYKMAEAHLEGATMSKSHDTKKDKKKPAQKTAKEKRQEKREKKRS
jgi:hypothetical protein